MSKRLSVHQALYGYRDGHRLLASSITLLPEVQRSLRSMTDTAFGASSGPYLTIYPLETQQMQAFIRTWPARNWTRPGSVWSHVLLVDNADLARIQGIAPLREAFRLPIPIAQRLPAGEISAYQTVLEVDPTGHAQVSDVDRGVLAAVVASLYTSREPVRVQTPHVSELEPALWAIYEQQWPRLRRNFACRTRGRSSSSAMDIEFLEGRSRPSVDPSVEIAETDEWVALAVDDLLRPDAAYRSFLFLGGAESNRGRQDFAELTRIYAAARNGHRNAARAVDLVSTAYPAPESHRALKRALFGAYGPREWIDGWPRDDVTRLSLAFAASRALDFGDLVVGERLVQLQRSRGGAAQALRALQIEDLTTENAEALVSGVTASADRGTAVSVAAGQPDLGLLIVTQTPSLLSEPKLWDALDNELLIDLLQYLPGARAEVLDELMHKGASEPIARICAAFPAEWWRLLAAASLFDGVALVERCATLRSALVRMGTAALETPPSKPRTPQELVALLLAADLSSGLWRRARTSDWISAVSADSRSFLDTLPRHAAERLYAVTLVSASSGSSSDEREKAWLACFGMLHRSLESPAFDAEAWGLLSNTLPAGTDWDRCQRLRRGAAIEIRRDQWNSQDVRALLAAASPYDDDLMNLLREQSNRKKKKDSLLRSLMKLLQ